MTGLGLLLDGSQLVVFGGVGALMAAVLLSVFRLGLSQRRGMGWWIASELMVAGGILGSQAQGLLPPLALNLCCNALLFGSSVCVEQGLRRSSLGTRATPLVGLWLALACFMVWTGVRLSDASFPQRAAAVSCGIGLQGMWLLYQMSGRTSDHDRMARGLLQACVALLTAAHLVRGINALLHGDDPVLQEQFARLAVQTLLLLFLSFGKTSAVLLLCHGRVERRLRAALAELQLRANTDAMTGLASRPHFEEGLQRQLANALRQGQSSVLLLLDVDHFKQINDQDGHPAGDRVLADVGRALRIAVREGDLCGRLGGDEFAALLSHCDLDGAVRVAQRLQQLLAAARDGRGPTVSVGLARASGDEGFATLFQRADLALYAAKQAGRNTWRIHGQPPGFPL